MFIMPVDNARGNLQHDGLVVFGVSPGFVSVLLGNHSCPYIDTTRIFGCKLLLFHSFLLLRSITLKLSE